MKKSALLLAILLILLAMPAQAAMILHDDFNGTSLDPSWNVTLNNASAWNHTVSGGALTVTDVNAISGGMSDATVGQSFAPLDDFQIAYDIAWSDTTASSLQMLRLSLKDDQGSDIAIAGYTKIWANSNYSTKSAWVFEPYTTTFAGTNQVPNPLLNGSASLDIIRQDGTINVFWDNELLLSAFNDAFLSGVDIKFSYFNGYGSNFGTESIDFITVSGDQVDLSATPEPGTMVLLGSALGLGVWWQRRRKRNKNIQA